MADHPLQSTHRRRARPAPDAHAIEYDGQWISWGQVGALARQIARWPSTAAGTAVGMLLRNRPAHVAAFLGVLLAAERWS